MWSSISVWRLALAASLSFTLVGCSASSARNQSVASDQTSSRGSGVSAESGESEPTGTAETDSARDTISNQVSAPSTNDQPTNTASASQTRVGSSDEPSSTLAGEGVEFIPWEEFAKSEVGDTGGGLESLGAPLLVTSVASTGGYSEEDLIVAVRVEGGDNLVVALDTRARTFRSHWLLFPCGDCLVAASSMGSVILTASALYGSTDGGYRYFTISEGDFGDGDRRVVRAVDDRVWIHTDAGWLGGAFDSTQQLVAPSWSVFGITSVDRSSALEVTSRYITKHSEAFDTTTTDVCASVPSITYGTAYHVEDIVVVPCDEQSVRVTRGFPDQPWETVALDTPLAWVGGSFVASRSSWYSVAEATLGQRVGSQAALQDGEVICGYAESEQQAYRVTTRGVAVTPGFDGQRTTP